MGFFLMALAPSVVSAQVVISEILYDLEGTDTGREWVEVFNAGSSSVMLPEWKLFEAETNHGLVAHSGNETLGSGAYAVIADNPAKFLEDHPTFSGVLFDSAFSLSNTGETLTLRCCGTGDSLTDKDTVSYNPEIGAAGDGNSLRRSSVAGVSFTASAPTPGTGQLQPTGGDTSEINTNETDAPASSEISTVNNPTPPSSASLTRVNAGGDRTVIVSVEARFEAVAYDAGNRSVEAQFLWNFGDGTTALGRTVTHRWQYPGRYAVVLEVLRFGEKASHKITVSVEAPNVSLEVLADGGVVVGNLSYRDLDVSGWRITDKTMLYIFPSNTLILRNASIRFSPMNLGFNATPETKLSYPNGHIAIHAASPSVKEEVIAAITSEGEQLLPVPETEPMDEDADPAASASDEDVESEEAEESIGEETPAPKNIEQVAAVAAVVDTDGGISLLWWMGASLAVGLGAMAVFLGRRFRKEKTHVERNTWNIIEEE